MQLITPLQLARLVVLSYPWFPDTLALTTWLAAEAGDQQAMAFFSMAHQSLRAQNTASAPFCLSISSRGGSCPFPSHWLHLRNHTATSV